ncbi:MAG: hypothetical protein WC473_03200 [Patescibacteria group bacterium]
MARVQKVNESAVLNDQDVPGGFMLSALDSSLPVTSKIPSGYKLQNPTVATQFLKRKFHRFLDLLGLSCVTINVQSFDRCSIRDFFGECLEIYDWDKRDLRAERLVFINWENVLFETHLNKGELKITGEEKLRRAEESGNIQLGVKAFLILWRNYIAYGKDCVLEKLYDSKGVECVYFFGDIMKNPNGRRSVICLCRDCPARWSWNHDLLEDSCKRISASLKG